MAYPSRLLPQKAYQKFILETDLQSLFLSVYTSDKDLTDSDGYLKDEHIVKVGGDFKDFSTYLLGVYQPDDCKWEWNKGGSNFKYYTRVIWQEGEEVIIPQVPTDIEEIHEKGAYYFCVDKIENKSISGKTGDGKTLVFTGKVVHTPMNGNFWHCSVRWFFNGNDCESTRLTDAEKKVLKIAAKNYLANSVAIFDLPDYKTIDEALYMKQVEESALPNEEADLPD